MEVLGTDPSHVMFVLKRGDKLIQTLTQVMTDQGYQGGVISGIGNLADVELGSFDLKTKTFLKKTFNQGSYELIHLSGNLTIKEGAPFIHVHAVLGNHDFSAFGGHLYEATVAVAAEIHLITLGKMPIRAFDENLGISPICGFTG